MAPSSSSRSLLVVVGPPGSVVATLSLRSRVHLTGGLQSRIWADIFDSMQHVWPVPYVVLCRRMHWEVVLHFA